MHSHPLHRRCFSQYYLLIPKLQSFQVTGSMYETKVGKCEKPAVSGNWTQGPWLELPMLSLLWPLSHDTGQPPALTILYKYCTGGIPNALCFAHLAAAQYVPSFRGQSEILSIGKELSCAELFSDSKYFLAVIAQCSEPWKFKPWTVNLIPTATAGLDCTFISYHWSCVH